MVTSVNTSGQSILTALGVGGGLNATELATNLVNAEKVPQQTLLDNQKNKLTATVSSVGKVKSALGTLQSSLTSLGDVKSFQTIATSTDTSRVTVAFKTGISPPTFTNYVQVQQVATATTVSFPPVSSIDTSILGTNNTPRTFRIVSGSVQNAVVAGSGMQLPATNHSGVVTINGVDINLNVDTSVSLSDNRKATVAAINAQSSITGVSAVDTGDDTKGITLTSGDGRSIRSSFAPGEGKVKFPDMVAGSSVTVAGLTFKADVDVSASDVADAFANITSGDPGSSITSNFGTFTGTLKGWSSGAVTVPGSDELIFTSSTSANQPDLSVGTSDVTQPITMSADTPWLTSAMTGLSVGDYGVSGGGLATLPGHMMSQPLSTGKGSIVVNGTTINVTMTNDVAANRSAIVAAINAQTKTTGVTATDNNSDEQGISLSAASGKSISVSFPQMIGSSLNVLDATNSGLSEATVNPPYKLAGTPTMTLSAAAKTGTVTINGIDIPITVGIVSNDNNRSAIVDAINNAITDAVNNGNNDLVGITASNDGDSKGITFSSIDGRAIKMGLSSNLTAADTGLKPNVLLSMDLTSSDTLVTVRDKINTISGMTANIVQGGTDASPLYYLSVKSATGAINNFYADVTAVGGTTPLDGADTSNLDPAADGLLGNYYTSLSLGQDAKISIDGVSISSTTNVFDKAIPGVTITAVSQTDANTPVTIKSETNTTALTAAINSLVTGYNQVIATMTTEMAYNSTDNTKSGGLANSAIARTLIEQLRSFTTQQIQGYDNNIYTLADIGVKTNRDGTLTLDQAAFNAALTNKPDMVAAVMASKKSLSDSRLLPGKIDSTAKAGVYTIKKEVELPQIATTTGKANSYETADVTFNDLAAGGYVTIGGLTFTATSAMTGTQVAAAFANLSNGAITGPSTNLGSYSGTLTGWSTGSTTLNKLTFSASNFGDVADLTASGTSVGWTINGQPATLNGMTLTAGLTSTAAGISVLIPTDLSSAAAEGFSATLNYSKGILERFNAMIDDATGTSSSLQSLSDDDNKALSDLTQKQTDLDNRMEAIRLRYVDQFSRVQTLLTKAESTKTSLTDFQTAWSNSLKGG
jgi:flagellar hook-associated protein 2